MAMAEDRRQQAFQRFRVIRPPLEARGVSNRGRTGAWYPAENGAAVDLFVGEPGPLGVPMPASKGVPRCIEWLDNFPRLVMLGRGAERWRIGRHVLFCCLARPRVRMRSGRLITVSDVSSSKMRREKRSCRC